MIRFLLYTTLTLLAGYTIAKPQRNIFDDERQRGQQFIKFSAQDVKGYNLKELNLEDDNSPSPTQQLRRPSFEDNYPNLISQVQQRPLQQQSQPGGQFRRPGQSPQQFKKQRGEDKELEEEIEEPDRLSLLLPNSKFDCAGKSTGYYADDGLKCEVFHYCQDGTKHSWICPEGFTFHQIHLICMPPSHDNICQKSSEYHFVNEYLYKPINLEEHETKPNVTLRYSDRFYPDNYHYYGAEQQQVEYQRYEPQPRKPQPQPQPVQVQFRRPPPPPPSPINFAPTLRPETHIPTQFKPSQVFHSPEEVNISLQQRRPLLISSPKPNYPAQPTGFDFQ